ncbi:MAG: hypothetical protein JWN92_2846, partial [Candidatus Acidoferrum typicum]|nr:hypothetical protein [Candidatus Acidoferrum typicum]
EHVLDAQSLKRRPVRFKISLNSEYPDFHAIFFKFTPALCGLCGFSP